MPDQNSEQPADQSVDFSHYFEENKKAVPQSPIIAAVKGLPGVVIKLSRGLIKTQIQANVVLVVVCLVCLSGAAYLLFAPQVQQQAHIVPPDPRIHPIK